MDPETEDQVNIRTVLVILASNVAAVAIVLLLGILFGWPVA
jgi:hypothetical protein